MIKPSHYQFLFLLALLLLIPVCGLMAQELTISDKIAARFAGPFHFRFLLQPLMAIILGIRDGKTDAHLGRPPYIFEILSNKGDRRENLKNGLKAILTPLVIGIVLDSVVQVYLFHSLRLWGALLVGGILVGLPYALARGIRNRLSGSNTGG